MIVKRPSAQTRERETMSSNPRSLPDRWREHAGDIRAYAAEAAAIFDQCADQLAEAFKRYDDEALTVGQAARESGYSTTHLFRALRQGKLPNAGFRGRPRIRRADLPHRPSRRGPQIL
jgi:hypothetical protein